LKAFKGLIINLHRRQVKSAKLNAAFQFRSRSLATLAFKLINGFHNRKVVLTRLMKKASHVHLQRTLLHLMRVGMHWKQIKGRFDQQHLRRLNLQMKYSAKWLLRIIYSH